MVTESTVFRRCNGVQRRIITTRLRGLEVLNQAASFVRHDLETGDTVEKFGKMLTEEQIE
jgi:hypothetical protein